MKLEMPALGKTRRNAIVVNDSDGRSIDVLGNEVKIKIASRETDNAFTVFESQTEPLQGPPLHLHRDQDECWYILEGEYRFEVDGQEIYACSGATVFAARGTRHSFQNIGTTPGRMITTVVPGGLDVFFEELATVQPRGSAPDPAKILPIFEKHGLELLGPPLAARTLTTA
jgi:mannose-6-phosphate isomerase-like protein (cupin superfamily)